MIFNSLHYIVFLFLIILAYWNIPHKYRWILLLIGSYYFYMCWRVEYIVLIILSTGVDYYCGRKMGQISIKKKRKPYLYISLLSNLSILFFFKYANFFTTNLNEVTGTSIPILKVLLPMGISFYTFQTMSYSIDIYNGKLKPEQNMGIFALFVTFFPQLVAGPIERAGNLLDQFKIKKEWSWVLFRSGLRLVLWGFFKKVVIADRLAIIVDEIYNHPDEYKGFALVVGTVFFAFQIYCDFSAYSDIARGSARMMGFHLMKNFDTPYFSKSLGEFWRRWHISLSTWFRDYIYIPLGGNRVVKWRWYYNLIITFVISGIWHGANWTFLIWGFLHGLYLIIETFFTIKSKNKFMSVLKILTVFTVVCVGWIFFRANSVHDAFYIVTHLTSGLDLSFVKSDIDSLYNYLIIGSTLPMLLIIEYLSKKKNILEILNSQPAMIRWSGYWAFILIILFGGMFVNPSTFIYFQF